MSLVEKKYNEALDRMTGLERVTRTFDLFSAIREILALQVSKEFGQLSHREQQKKIAERMYLSDESTKKLLARMS